MAYLEDLRFTHTGVTNEQHVDVPTVPRSTATAAPSDALVRAAKQLQEYALLHVLHRVDGRGEGPRQELVDVRPLAELAQARLQLFPLRRPLLSLRGVLPVVVHVDSAADAADAADARDLVPASRACAPVQFELVVRAEPYVDDVEERAEEALERTLAWVHTHGNGAEDARDDETVSRL